MSEDTHTETRAEEDVEGIDDSKTGSQGRPVDSEEEGDVGDAQSEGGTQSDAIELEIPLLGTRRQSLSKAHLLVTSKKARQMALLAMRLGVLADSVNTVILRPSYPFMVIPPDEGGSPDSFPSTEPFDFGAAQYFLPLSSLLATAIAATFVGSLSDRVGRRPVMLVCLAFGVVGSIAKYLARGSFWAYCGCNFMTGLFGATLAVSIAYASDVAHSRQEKDGIIGSLVATSMVGATGGGIIAIAMSNVGLFEPLLVGASMNSVTTIFNYFYLIEPNKLLHMGVVEAKDDGATEAMTEDGSNNGKDPVHLDWKVAGNILFGSLLDNAGSTGYVPFCLSPLMFNTFLVDFVENGLSPIMSPNAYRWISTLLALMIIPAAAGSSKLFERIGAPAGCVLGNSLTGVFTIVLLLIATRADVTTVSYALYIATMYLGFPLTVLSQLSTGPMLDRISPSNQRGFTQGLNTMVMNLGQAIFPWAFGLFSDSAGVETTLWVCIGISFAAAVVNVPLIFAVMLRPAPRVIQIPEYSRHVHGEDKDVIEKALRGEWVPPIVLREINGQRLKDGHQFLSIPYKSYDEDRASNQIVTIGRHAREDFQFLTERMTGYIQSDFMRTEEKRELLAKQIKQARVPMEKRTELAQDLGQWFGDYMLDAGYQVDESPFVLKQMILSAFPRIMKSSDHNELTPDNLEQVTLNFARVYNHFMEEEENAPHIQAFAGGYGMHA